MDSHAERERWEKQRREAQRRLAFIERADTVAAVRDAGVWLVDLVITRNGSGHRFSVGLAPAVGNGDHQAAFDRLAFDVFAPLIDAGLEELERRLRMAGRHEPDPRALAATALEHAREGVSVHFYEGLGYPPEAPAAPVPVPVPAIAEGDEAPPAPLSDDDLGF